MFKTAATGRACRRMHVRKTAYNPEKVARSKALLAALSHTGTLAIPLDVNRRGPKKAG
jgi:hypothetical protein